MTADITPETAAKLAELRAPFAAEYVGKLPKVTCKACSDNKLQKHCDNHQRRECPVCKNYITAAHIHLDYIGHAETTDRLLKVDPSWTWEPQARAVDPQLLAAACASGNPEIVRLVMESAPPKLDQNGGMWINLTVCGVTRPGYGDAQGKTGPNAVKEVIGDAIRNASMRFGVGLDLWSKSEMGEIEADRLASEQDRTAEGPTRQVGANGDSRPVRAVQQRPAQKGNGQKAAPAQQQRLAAPYPTGPSGWPLLPDTDNVDTWKRYVAAVARKANRARYADPADPNGVLPGPLADDYAAYTKTQGAPDGLLLKHAGPDDLAGFAVHIKNTAPAQSNGHTPTGVAA